jgi:hypothetical protein
MGLKQVRGIQCALTIAGSVDWIANTSLIKEEGGALALGGRQSMTTTNNQPDR